MEDSTRLALDRYRGIHDQFIQAGKRFPELCVIAVHALVRFPMWPDVPYDRGLSHGLPVDIWREILRKPPGALFSPTRTGWIQIDDQLWQWGIFHEGNTALEGPQLSQQREQIEDACREFQRLACLAGEHLGVVAMHAGIVDPLKGDLQDRWLATIFQTPFFPPVDEGGILVRRINGDAFNASARTIDILTDARMANQPESTPENTAAVKLNPGKKSKCSTKKGDAQAKLIAALTKHHDYSGGSCLNLVPIGNNERPGGGCHNLYGASL